MTDRPICAVFDLACKLGIASGAAPLNGKTWVYDVDPHWKIAMNGGRASVECEPDGCMSIEIAPFNMAVWWHGWLAGTVGPYDGVLVAHPEGANEDLLISAMRSKLEELQVEA